MEGSSQRFDIEVDVNMHELFDTSFLLTYFEDKDVPFQISHYAESAECANADRILYYRIEEFCQQYKIIEFILGNWIKEQPTLRLQYVSKPWLKKRISIRKIEE